MFVSKSVRSLESHYYLARVSHIFLSFILVGIVGLSQIICHCPDNSPSSIYRLLFVVPACPIPWCTKISFLLQHDNRSSVPESRSLPKSGRLKVFSSRTLLHTLFSQNINYTKKNGVGPHLLSVVDVCNNCRIHYVTASMTTIDLYSKRFRVGDHTF